MASLHRNSSFPIVTQENREQPGRRHRPGSNAPGVTGRETPHILPAGPHCYIHGPCGPGAGTCPVPGGGAGRQYHPREHAASSALGDWGPAPWGDSPAPGGRGSRRGARGLAVQEGGGGPFALTMGFCWEGPGMDTPLLVFPAFLVTCTYTFPWSLETRQW